ncbi:MAG: hypothetical protein KF687_05930 [Cyclobacteriaceae bacterium]|nr:hypothetical protein [Cyclobacteriaceae bacterium]
MSRLTDQNIADPIRLSESTLVNKISTTALIFFFIADFGNKLLIHLQYDFSRFSIIPRAIYELFFLTIILLFPNKERVTFLIVFVTVFVTFLIGQIVFAANIQYDYNFRENLLMFNKYFFVFIIYYGVYKARDNLKEFSRAIRLMEVVFVVNSLLAIVGFIFSIDLFRTYINQPYRYGYSGALWVQNEASIFYFLALAYFYYKRFILGMPSKRFYVVLLGSLLLGTKMIYVFHLALITFHFIYHSNVRTKIYSMFIIVGSYFSFLSFIQTQSGKLVLSYFEDKVRSGGFWYMFSSGRTHYLSSVKPEVLDYWSVVNLFFGGQDQTKFMTEMDFLDLFLFMGLFGSVVYLILLYKTIFRFKLLSSFNLFFVASYMVLAFASGHFFSSVINALYLCLISLFLYNSQKVYKNAF